MKTLALLGALFFGTWFAQRPAASSDHGWPDGLPAFAGGRADCSYTLKNGSSFASFTTLTPAGEVLSSARASFAGAGWSEIPLQMSDTLLFVRGESVAAVLAEITDRGTRVTAIQRPKGL